jgi:aminoglycoside phosphotransferase (APT) family kinase protein
MQRPPADIPSDPQIAAALVSDQHPSLAAPVTLTAEGWDNVIYRLGDDLAVRLPRRAVAIPLLLNEQRWLPGLAAVLPVTIPAPVAVGVPSDAFPWPWSIIRWVEGAGLDEVDAETRDAVADSFADTLLALHRPAPHGAPHNPVRGVPLVARTATWAGYRSRAGLSDSELDVIEAALADGLDAELHPGPPVWVHGDPHPANTVVDPATGTLVALLDFGDLSAGDPATDLAAAWFGFGPVGRARLIERLDADGDYDPDVWRRAKAWAAGTTLAIAAHSDDAPRMRAIADHTLIQLSHAAG